MSPILILPRCFWASNRPKVHSASRLLRDLLDERRTAQRATEIRLVTDSREVTLRLVVRMQIVAPGHRGPTGVPRGHMVRYFME